MQKSIEIEWGECVGSVLSYPVPPTQHSLSLAFFITVLSPKGHTTKLAFLLPFVFCVLGASYAIVYVFCCSFCSLISVPANGGGIILWISCYYLIFFIWNPFSSIIFFSLLLLYPSKHDFLVVFYCFFSLFPFIHPSCSTLLRVCVC